MKTPGNIEKYYYHAFPMHAVLVTCNDDKDKTNAITIAWHTPISKKPPLYGISVAPSRYSHTLINTAKEFVINFLPYDYIKHIHYCGTRSGKDTEKLKEIGLTLEPSKTLQTPQIKEGYAHLECKLYDAPTIGDHTLFIGNITHVSGLKDAFSSEILDTNIIQPSLYLGDNYYITASKSKDKC